MPDDAEEIIQKARLIYIECGQIYHGLNRFRDKPVTPGAWRVGRNTLRSSLEELAELAARGGPEQQLQVTTWLMGVAVWLSEMPVNC